jgi:high-affinity Fe2+/Pb2+ permease
MNTEWTLTCVWVLVSMVLPSVIGVVSGLIIGLIFFRSANELNMKVLAGVSTALLLLVAAGLCSNSFYGLQEAGAFPGASDAAVFELGRCVIVVVFVAALLTIVTAVAVPATPSGSLCQRFSAITRRPRRSSSAHT